MKRRGNIWEIHYESVKEFYIKHGNCDIPFEYITKDGYKLGNWAYEQRRAYKKGLLRIDEIEKLQEIDFDFDGREKGYVGGVSFPEAILLFYIKKVDPDAIKLGKKDWLGTEIDVYIPSRKIGIEYDSYTYHKRLVAQTFRSIEF